MSQLKLKKTTHESLPPWKRKLQPSEDDWVLESGTKRVCLPAATALATPKRVVPRTVPPPCRGIVELKNMKKHVENNLVCAHCHQSVTFECSTAMAATMMPTITCNKSSCGGCHGELPPFGNAVFQVGKNAGNAHAANVLHALGFLVSGDGGTEAERLLGFLGMPNAATMQKSYD